MAICSKPRFTQSTQQRSFSIAFALSRFTSWSLCIALVSAFSLSGPVAYAQEATDQTPATQDSLETTSQTSADSNEYYTIDEGQTNFNPPTDSVDMSPMYAISMTTMAAKLRALAFSLLSWTLHAESPGLPKEKYNRKFHFGRWINDPNDNTCYNTRTKVLIRDSEAPVAFKQKNHCLVETGTWAEPYVGKEISTSREIQIDHMVPLKNAYMSGAWEWDFQTRCMYANFMGNKFHLISASGTENMRKGDRAPDKYMPPYQPYRCQYLENWLKIKLIWKLKMTPAEVDAIKSGIQVNGCDPANFALSQRELRQQRQLINEKNDVCPVR